MSHTARSHMAAEVARLQEQLIHCGSLTKERLFELSGGANWPSSKPFHAALAEGIRTGAIVQLTDGLYTVPPEVRG